MEAVVILVTGGLGFIGSAWTRALVRRGENVRVLDNISRGNAGRLADVKYEFYAGDVRSARDMFAASDGAREIHHLAFVNGTKNFYEVPDLVLDVGVKGMVNVLEACRINRIGRLFLVSSSEVYQTPPTVPTSEIVPLSIPDPYNPRYSYAAGKIISEMMALHCGRFDRLVIVRPHNIYGPDMGWEHVIPELARKIVRGDTLLFQGNKPKKPGALWGGEQTRAFCYVSDAIEGFRVAWERGEHLGIYNVGTQEEITIIDLARRIASLANKPVNISYEKASDGGTLRRCPDMTKLKSLGYVPHVSLDAGLRTTMEFYLAHHAQMSELPS